MSNLVPRDSVFQSLFDVRRDFDQIFNRMLTGWPFSEGSVPQSAVGFTPAVESYVDKKNRLYHCRIALPGIEPNDVQVQAHGNMLAITGERKCSHKPDDVDFQHNELWYGSFERMLSLPEGVDIDKLTADYRNGVLEITAPVSASVLPRQIEIKINNGSKQFAATA
jgi:HSP20 family protein